MWLVLFILTFIVPSIFYGAISAVFFLLVNKVFYLIFPYNSPKDVPFPPVWLAISCIPVIRLIFALIEEGYKHHSPTMRVLSVIFTIVSFFVPLPFLILYLKIPSKQVFTFIFCFLLSTIGALFLYSLRTFGGGMIIYYFYPFYIYLYSPPP